VRSVHTLSQISSHVADIDERSSRVGLRTVAAFETLKGVLVLALTVVVFAVHNRAEDLAESLLFHLHINADRHLSHAVMDVATRLTDTRLLTIAAAGITYAAVRFIESWGLWNRRVWAEWFALLSGALYLPIEILKLSKHPRWLVWGIFLGNLVIVLYMLYVRVVSFRARKRPVFKRKPLSI
jgi:uncharacterized membrane protein (DUF2068 family)